MAASGRLEWLTLRNRETATRSESRRAGLLLLLGADPCSEWLPDGVARDDKDFVLTGRDVPPELWTGERPPAALATTMPGVFAVGDIRRAR